MPPGYIDGKNPQTVTYLNATLGVITPDLQASAAAVTVAVPQPANNDTIAVLTSTQTLSSKTLIGPVISSGNWYLGKFTQPTITSAALTQPVITTGVLTSPAIALSGGSIDGGLINNAILGARTLKTAAVGTAKTLDLSTADIYLVQLTCSTVLTVSNCPTGKNYQLIVQQDISNSYTEVAYMSGFINSFVDSGIAQKTGTVDYWDITFDGSRHYAIGVKDIQ